MGFIRFLPPALRKDTLAPMPSLSAIDRLRLFLRPPGRGLLTVSTGGGWANHLAKELYGSDNPTVVAGAWEDTLQKIRRSKRMGFGVPSDTGAGIVRGANLGPIGIREAYLRRWGSLPKDFLDLGDIATVPQLLHDEMLNGEQIALVRTALYQDKGEGLPVSPLSITQAVVEAIWELNPEAKLTILGGDHSISWPVVNAYIQKYPDDLGILHFDAHTDMMASRFGVKYCFATWAYHTMKLLKPHHLVQVGLRVSGRDKAYWTEKYPIIQVWADEVRQGEEAVGERIAEHFANVGVSKIYVSNDIDGTDSQWASATGTPETDGLTPDFVTGLIKRLARDFTIVGGDIVEVAPPLSGLRDFSEEPTCQLGAEYWKVLLETFDK